MEFKEKKLTIKVSWGFNGYFNTPPEFHSSVEWSYEDEQTGDSLFQTSVNKASVGVRALLVEGGAASSAEAGAAVAQRCSCSGECGEDGIASGCRDDRTGAGASNNGVNSERIK